MTYKNLNSVTVRDVLFNTSSANICALELAMIRKKKVMYIGYGTPRVGNKAYVDLFHKNISSEYRVRIKAGRDPVCTVPMFTYEHIEPNIHVGRADPYPNVCLLLDLPDHDLDYYIACLKLDETSERPLAWASYIFGFVWDLPYRLFKILARYSVYRPF
jgi:hypothetical protein